jgi:exodeoxyribonuclease III
MKLITANLNGIRSAAKKGFFEWLVRQRADAAGVQELKAQQDDIDDESRRCGRLTGHFHYARTKGYAGVGLYTQAAPSDVVQGIGVEEFDNEGRWVEARFDKPGRKLSIISCYFPSGSSGAHRQLSKFRFLDVIYPHLVALKAKRDFVLLGDVNIAHREIDLKNWKSNQKNSGFLPEERAWLTRLFGDAGLVDVYRRLEPEATDAAYTWWSNRGGARENNVGWRIDYHIATPRLAAVATSAKIYKRAWFSDHAPLTIEYAAKI